MKTDRKDMLLILSVFLLLVIFKYLFALGTVGPIISDEVLYKINARNIFMHEPFSTLHYPPLYSLLLSAAFFSKNNWYQWMLFLNAMVSSLIVIPVWLIGSRFLPKSFARISVIIAGLWSFHVAYPRTLMSENLYVLFFLVSVFIFLDADREDSRHSWRLYALFGFFTALAYLTKYIHLVSIPCFAILWWVRPMFRDDAEKGTMSEKVRLYQAAAAAGGFAIVYVPWVLYVWNNGFPEAQALGLQHIAYMTKYATLSSLAVWIAFYTAYVVLMMAPFLLPLSIYFNLMISGKIKNDRKETFFMVTISLLTFVFLMTAIYHSWRAAYNYPVPNRIMGRYLLQFSPFYLIIFLIALNKIKDALHLLNLRQVLFCSLFSLTVIFLSQALLFRVPGWQLKFDFINSPEGVPYQLKVFTFFILLFVLILTGMLALRFRNVHFTGRHMVVFSILLVVAVQIISSFGAFQWSIIRNRQVVHSKMLAEFLKHEGEGNGGKITVIYDIPSRSRYYSSLLLDSLTFWLDLPWRDKSVSFTPVSDYSLQHREDSDRLYLLTRVHSGPPLMQYVIRKIQIAKYELFRKMILDRYPHAEALHLDQTYYLYNLKDQSVKQHTRGNGL
jgi:4-amino-4-deoxy-L-arabinose transferase-like glycosyltransferase